MLIQIKYSDGSNAPEGRVIRIYKETGDAVKSGEVLFDVEANKAVTSIESGADGTINSIKIEEGQMVKAGDLLAEIDGVAAAPETAVNKDSMDYFGSLLSPKNEEWDSDIAIIGGGPGGYVAAIRAAQKGANVVLVEGDSLGGTCLNRGCIPTKAIVRSAEIYRQLQEAEMFGCHAEKISLDMAKVIKRKNEIVGQLVNGIKSLLDSHHVRVAEGIGTIEDSKTVRVKKGMQEIIVHAEQMIIATGSKISQPPFEITDGSSVINSDQALEMTELPQQLVIIGGGVIGMEFAFAFANFGIQVYVIEYCSRCLGTLDDDVCEEMIRIAKEKGIHLYTGAAVEQVIPSVDGSGVVFFKQDGETKCVSGEKILVAVGREPVLEGIDPEKLGLELNENKRGIKVNSRMQTNIPNIYAIGDVTDKIQLAHVASKQGIVAVENILGNPCEMDYTAVPSAIFTEPEIAVVGISEKEAEKQGLEIEVGKFPYSASGKALTWGDNRGFVKIIKDKATGKIIGGAIIGIHATDLIAEITLAVQNQLTVEQVMQTIHAHPTTAEVVSEAVMAAAGCPLHFVEK